jgi:hypothetical protein
MSGYFPFNQELPRICLDQSNSYFYGSNCFSQRDNQPFPSMAYADAFESQPRPDQRSKVEDATNLADFSFLRNIKEIEPKAADHMFEFDITPTIGANPFAQPLFRSDSEQDRLFASQAQLMQRASSHRSHRSNHSRSRPSEPFEVQGQSVDEGESQRLLNRSWAYSSIQL